MRSIFLVLLTFVVVPATHAQTEYNGKLILLFSDTVKGMFRMDLHGPNNSMVEVTSVELVPNKNKYAKQKFISQTIKEKYNPGIITAVFIEGTRYRLRDLKNDYGDNMIQRNCCVKRVAGTDTLGLFEFVNKAGVSSFYFQGPKDGVDIYNIDHPYVSGDLSSYSLLRLYSCEFIREKIKAKAPGYFYTETGSITSERVEVWKNIIKGYYEHCNK